MPRDPATVTMDRNLGMTEMDVRLRYVYRETLPSGRVRYRYERAGRKVTLQGDPGSPQFMACYQSAIDNLPAPDTTAATGSIAWLVGLFLRDLDMRVRAGLASPLTLRGHRHHLSRLVDAYGRKDCRMPRKKVVELLDQFTATSGARDNLRKSISALFTWALDKEHIDPASYQNPARTIRRIHKSKGFYTCTIDDVRAYMRHHGPGTMARRVMVLELCTAARREDLRTLGPFNEFTRHGARWLRWTQSKSPNRVIEIPMLPMLITEVTDIRDGTYIRNAHGQPYSHGSIGNNVRQWFSAAQSQGSLHGVRKGLSAILPQMGATSYEIDVLLGHEMGSADSKVYVAEAERTAIAASLGKKMAGFKW